MEASTSCLTRDVASTSTEAARWPQGQSTDTFNFREQIGADSTPKLSIHNSGQVHIYANEQAKAGPVFIPPLDDLRGEHVATVHQRHEDDGEVGMAVRERQGCGIRHHIVAVRVGLSGGRDHRLGGIDADRGVPELP